MKARKKLFHIHVITKLFLVIVGRRLATKLKTGPTTSFIQFSIWMLASKELTMRILVLTIFDFSMVFFSSLLFISQKGAYCNLISKFFYAFEKQNDFRGVRTYEISPILPKLVYYNQLTNFLWYKYIVQQHEAKWIG